MIYGESKVSVCEIMRFVRRGVTALIRAVSEEKQIYFGNLEIFPGIRKPGKFFGKYKIFSGTLSKDLILHVIKQYICILCMRCILCILTLENSLTPHDVKRPISNVSN